MAATYSTILSTFLLAWVVSLVLGNVQAMFFSSDICAVEGRIVGSVQKIYMSKVYGPNYQQSNRIEKKNSRRSRLMKKKVSFKMQDCEPFGTFRAYLKHLPVIERVYFFQIFIANVLWNFCCFALLPLGTLAVERASTLKVFKPSEASIYIILNRPRRRSTSTLGQNLAST